MAPKGFDAPLGTGFLAYGYCCLRPTKTRVEPVSASIAAGTNVATSLVLARVLFFELVVVPLFVDEDVLLRVEDELPEAFLVH